MNSIIRVRRCCVEDEVKLLAGMRLKTAGLLDRTDGPVLHGVGMTGWERTEKITTNLISVILQRA